ncbi:MAG: DUF1501 domain-containing protein [Gemmataceae bacterium]
MLTLQENGTRLCDGLTRRDWLRVGGLGLYGLTTASLLQARGAASSPTKKKSCIVIFLLGGPAQHETWDTKPNAPAEVRGDLKPIASRVPGMLVGELMPRIAKLTDKISVLRAVRTGDNAHTSSGYYMCTGVPHRPQNVENALPGAPNDWPNMGAVVRHLHREPGLPAAIMLPEIARNDGTPKWPGQDAGWLGRAHDPWLLTCNPADAQFSVPELRLPAEVPAERLEGRVRLVEQINRRLDQLEKSPAIGRFGVHRQQAVDLLCARKSRRAFELGDEPPSVRDRYGRNRFGQSMLLARRLVEAGVPLVQINWPRDTVPGLQHWDTHSKNTEGLKKLLPVADLAYTALLEDLIDRGLLDDTLVVWTSEFGRTPKINGGGGRDHWGRVFSVALAGGGVKGGHVHGASDAVAGEPQDGIVKPEDLAATLFHCLGHQPDTEIHDSLDRPIPISRGSVIQPILA